MALVAAMHLCAASLWAADAFPDPCLGMDAAWASGLLEVPAAELVVVPNPVEMQPGEGASCMIRSRESFFRNISFMLYRKKDAASAAADLRDMKEGFSFLSPVEPVPGLGDEAVRATDERVGRLLVRRGRVLMDISMPRDPALQRKVAEFLLSRLAASGEVR